MGARPSPKIHLEIVPGRHRYRPAGYRRISPPIALTDAYRRAIPENDALQYPARAKGAVALQEPLGIGKEGKIGKHRYRAARYRRLPPPIVLIAAYRRVLPGNGALQHPARAGAVLNLAFLVYLLCLHFMRISN